MSNWNLYMIRCRDNSLYTGITNDVNKRFNEHQNDNKRCAKYLRGRRPLSLVFKQNIGSKSKATKVEREVKKFSKERKERLIIDPTIIEDLI